jgi:hypothetical protein
VPSVSSRGCHVDVGQMLLGRSDELRQFRPLEGDGLALGIVLVIGMGVHRCRDDRLEIPGYRSTTVLAPSDGTLHETGRRHVIDQR